LDPLSYKQRNNTTIIVCGEEGYESVFNPIIWFLQYYSQFYEDFVDEFLDFHYKYLGDDYYNTYKEDKVAKNGKYNNIFKMMMKEHFLFLTYFPKSRLQIFGRQDQIANLTLHATEDVDLTFSVPLYDNDVEKFTKHLNRMNFTDYFNYSVIPKSPGDPPYFQEIQTWMNGNLMEHHHIIPMALTDRRMHMIDMGKKTNVFEICKQIPTNSILILTACRNLNQVLKTQVYKHKPSLQQVISKLQKLQLQTKSSGKKRTRQQTQQPPKKKIKSPQKRIEKLI
jgi:hypothetical protein